MRWLVLAFLIGCASPMIRGGNQEIEVRIDNDGWREAHVYVLPAGGTMGRRIATVTSSSRQTVSLRPSPAFRFYVTFLASNDRWEDTRVWHGSYPCLLVVIRSPHAHSYVTPCRV